MSTRHMQQLRRGDFFHWHYLQPIPVEDHPQVPGRVFPFVNPGCVVGGPQEVRRTTKKWPSVLWAIMSSR